MVVETTIALHQPLWKTGFDFCQSAICRTIMRLAQTFKKLKAKMRLQSSNKRHSIQQGAVEFIQKKLQDAEDKIAQDL